MAEEVKWTPGPWTVEDPMSGIGVLSIVADGDKEVYEWTHIAQVSIDDDNTDAQGVTLAQAEANAALIAAAPELFEALSAIMKAEEEAMAEWRKDGGPEWRAGHPAYDRYIAARSALLKAQAGGVEGADTALALQRSATPNVR